ncbi:AAEL001849-PA, partial [Aedes aegypti]
DGLAIDSEKMSYNTNKRRVVRTLGSDRLVYLFIKKQRIVSKCCQCKGEAVRNQASVHVCMCRCLKTVIRTFGGVICHRERIIRAFLIDEQKVVKVLKALQLGKPVRKPPKLQKTPAKTASKSK